MAFLLKIVEGPNKGAEIALVEGVAITLGKKDDCDVILADPTLPDDPLEISATADTVLVGGVPLEPFNVRTAGSTSIAVGPADAPWGPLVWPKPEEEADSQKSDDGDTDESESTKAKDEEQKADDDNTSDDSTDKPTDEQTEKRKRRGYLIAAVAILLLLLLFGWLFRAALLLRAHTLCDKVGLKWRSNGGGVISAVDANAPASPSFAIERIAGRYQLLLEEVNGRAKLSGNFATRAERLKATAEAYATRPGIDLDFSDDESFRTAAEDSLFTLTEGALKVMVATNRYLHLSGISESPLTLQETLKLLNQDLPKLRGFDVADVKLVSPAEPVAPTVRRPATSTVQRPTTPAAKRPARPATPSLPVCGILTTPYPCLVMRDGRRILEGGMVGDATILSIAADSVTVTNSAGRFTWKP